MFVIVGAWQNLSDEEKKQPIPEKMAMALKHAGVSITVTSVTDIVAFGIGGSTVSVQLGLSKIDTNYMFVLDFDSCFSM